MMQFPEISRVLSGKNLRILFESLWVWTWNVITHYSLNIFHTKHPTKYLQGCLVFTWSWPLRTTKVFFVKVKSLPCSDIQCKATRSFKVIDFEVFCACDDSTKIPISCSGKLMNKIENFCVTIVFQSSILSINLFTRRRKNTSIANTSSATIERHKHGKAVLMSSMMSSLSLKAPWYNASSTIFGSSAINVLINRLMIIIMMVLVNYYCCTVQTVRLFFSIRWEIERHFELITFMCVFYDLLFYFSWTFACGR